MSRGNTGEWGGNKDVESGHYDWDIFGGTLLHRIRLNRSGEVSEKGGGE